MQFVSPVCIAQVTRLRYTPRKFVIHPDHNTLIVAEADHAAVPSAERKAAENGMDTDGQQAEVRQRWHMETHAAPALYACSQELHCNIPCWMCGADVGHRV